MSATNRGSERHPQDFYETPAYITKSLFKWMEQHEIEEDHYWDPCAGMGAIIRARLDLSWFGTELQSRKAFENPYLSIIFDCDFLTIRILAVNDVAIVTNPPYSNALEIIQHARKFGCWAWFMLRLNFLGSLERSEFWQTNMPRHILVLSERPKMALNKHGKLGSDATEYAWFGWYGSEQNHNAQIEVLPPWKDGK